MDFALLWDGIPTRRSTSPPPIMWRRESSKPAETKPKKLVRAKCEQVVQFTNPGKKIPAEHFDGNASLVLPQVQLHSLRGFRKIVNNENLLSPQLPDVSQ